VAQASRSVDNWVLVLFPRGHAVDTLLIDHNQEGRLWMLAMGYVFDLLRVFTPFHMKRALSVMHAPCGVRCSSGKNVVLVIFYGGMEQQVYKSPSFFLPALRPNSPLHSSEIMVICGGHRSVPVYASSRSCVSCCVVRLEPLRPSFQS
jgi:hypothetical protein